MTRPLLIAAMVITLIAGCAQAAFGNSGGGAKCDPTVDSCTITASSSGSPAPTNSSSHQNGNDGNGSSSIEGSESGSGGGAAPSPTRTVVNGACTYQTDPSYQPPAGISPGKQPGAWYLMTCPDAINSNGIATTTTQVTWVPNGTLPTALKLPAPEVLAAEAEKQLKLPVPAIDSNPAPGRPQLVSVPMWAWVSASQFAPRTATATVPGESVTATAKPVSVTWSWGDGTSTICSGPGTVYSSADAANAVSPTCGHTYTSDSGTGDFTVQATITWNVTWVGGGQAGAFNGMTTTATEAVHVEQSRALVTGD
jgi:hypothetical protein